MTEPTTAADTSSTSSSPAAGGAAAAQARPAHADPAGVAARYTTTEAVTAVQYTAPDGAGEPGNIDEVESLGLRVERQEPWDPAAGQNCILVTAPAQGEHERPVRVLVQPDQYVATGDDGGCQVLHADEFTAKYGRAN